MMEKADSSTSRPRRSQQKNSRFADAEWEVEKLERKPRTTNHNINPEGVKVNPEGVKVNTEGAKVNSEEVKRKRGRPRKSENFSAPKENKPQATRTLTKRGLKNSALTKSKKPYAQKYSLKSTEVYDLSQEQGHFEQLPVKKKRGRPPGKKNFPKIKAEKRALPITKHENTLDESDSDGSYPMTPVWKKKSVTFKKPHHTSCSESDFTSSPVKKDGLKRIKLEKFEAGKLKLQHLKALAVERFGSSNEKAEEVNEKDSDEETDHASLSSESDEADSDLSSEQLSDFPEDWGYDSSCINSDEEDMIHDSDGEDSSGKNESEKQNKKVRKHSDSFVDGMQKLNEIKKRAAALYNTTSTREEMSDSENTTAIPSTQSVKQSSDSNTSMTYQVSEHANNIEIKEECQENEYDQIASINQAEEMQDVESLNRRSKAKTLSNGGKESFKESEEYYNGKLKLEKMQQMASRLYGVTAKKQQPSVKRQYRRLKDQASSQTHVSSSEYGEIVSVSDSKNPVTTYKLGDKHAYTVTYSEDNPDVLTFALEPPPPPETLSRNNISASLSQDLLKITKNLQLREDTQQAEGITESGIEFSTLLEGGETQGRISILPSTFSSGCTGMSSYRADLQIASDTSEQAQTIVVTAPGQEHLLTEGDMQNAYTVEIQHPDGTTQEHVSFDNGLTFVVNEMPEGSGTVSQNALPVSLAELADLASLQMASSDGHNLALPGFSFAQEEVTDTDSIHTHIDQPTLKCLTDGVFSDQQIVFIVKQEEEGDSPINSAGFTQWSICGDNAIEQKVNHESSASSNILNAAAELSRITCSRRGNVSQEFLDGEVNLERLKQFATTFQDSTGNDT